MLRAWRGLLFAVLLVGMFLMPSKAEAKGLLLITYGDSIKHMADVPAEAKAAITEDLGPGVAIGYKYSYAGMFWLDIWTWGGEYCLFKDKTFWSLKPEQAAKLMGVKETELKKPLLYSFPPLLMLVLLAGLLIVAAVAKSMMDDKKAEELLRDPRYAPLREILTGPPADASHPFVAQRAAAVAAAEKHLIAAGVPEAKAKADVALLESSIGTKESTDSSSDDSAQSAAPPAAPPSAAAPPADPAAPAPPAK
ncbi:MAG TPA: hypothetical protein PLA87_23285 [Pseudomonadota bacterium]|jgi:hypothetical protein|nr:hypothetical protein [Pseudomonadota bacterium]